MQFRVVKTPINSTMLVGHLLGADEVARIVDEDVGDLLARAKRASSIEARDYRFETVLEEGEIESAFTETREEAARLGGLLTNLILAVRRVTEELNAGSDARAAIEGLEAAADSAENSAYAATSNRRAQTDA